MWQTRKIKFALIRIISKFYKIHKIYVSQSLLGQKQVADASEWHFICNSSVSSLLFLLSRYKHNFQGQ